MNWVKRCGRCSRTMTTYPPNQPINSACPSLFKQTLTDLLALATITKTTIDTFVPATEVLAPITTELRATITMPPALFVRFAWIDAHPGEKFDSTSSVSIYELKDFYVEYGLDWTTDPVLNPPVRI